MIGVPQNSQQSQAVGGRGADRFVADIQCTGHFEHPGAGLVHRRPAFVVQGRNKGGPADPERGG